MTTDTEARHARIAELNEQMTDALLKRAFYQEQFDRLYNEYELLNQDCFDTECSCTSDTQERKGDTEVKLQN